MYTNFINLHNNLELIRVVTIKEMTVYISLVIYGVIRKGIVGKLLKIIAFSMYSMCLIKIWLLEKMENITVTYYIITTILLT